jgi:hypothetical protein
LEGLLKYPGGGLAKDRRDAGQIPVSFGILKKPAGFVTGKKTCASRSIPPPLRGQYPWCIRQNPALCLRGLMVKI